jgi:hypothetical protein
MDANSITPDSDPREWLADSRELARRVRNDQRLTWFPLLVLAALTFAAIPIQRYSHASHTCHSGAPHGDSLQVVCTVYSTSAFVYWPLALIGAYVVTGWFYVDRARNRGVGTLVRPYAIAGTVIGLVLTAVSIWEVHDPLLGRHDLLGWHADADSFGLFLRFTGPACAIGLGLLVLAWIERNRALLAVVIVYLVVVLVPVDFGWKLGHPSVLHHASRWAGAPRLVIAGTVLALAGVGFALAQRSRRTPPA